MWFLAGLTTGLALGLIAFLLLPRQWVFRLKHRQMIKRDRERDQLLQGAEVGDVEMALVDGTKCRLGEEHRTTILHTYAPDCGPCLSSWPNILWLAEHLRDKGVTLLLVAHGTTDTIDLLRRFPVPDHPHVKRAAIAEPYTESSFGARLQIYRAPLTMVLDEQARILHTSIHPSSIYAHSIEHLLPASNPNTRSP